MEWASCPGAIAEAGSIYVHLKSPSNASDDSTNLVELPQYPISTPSMSHDVITYNGNDVSPSSPVISNHTTTPTSCTSPILIDDDQVQKNTITADNPVTENVNEGRYSNSNLTEEVTNIVDYTAVETVDSDSSQITYEQTSADVCQDWQNCSHATLLSSKCASIQSSWLSLSKCLECFIEGPPLNP